MSDDPKEDVAQKPVGKEPLHESQQGHDLQDLDVSEAESQSILGGAAGVGKGRGE
jgi:hypothetical protein